MKFSVFPNARSVTPCSNRSLEWVHRAITKGGGKLASFTNDVQQKAILSKQSPDDLETQKAVSRAKQKLCAISGSGTFKSRAKGIDDNARGFSHNGLLQLDFDHVEPPQIPRLIESLKECSHIALAFISPSGFGVKAFYRVALPEMRGDFAYWQGWHKAVYQALRPELEDAFEHPLDGAAGDVTRLCFLPYDPDAFLNLQAIPRAVEVQEPPEKRPRPTQEMPVSSSGESCTTEENMRRILFEIQTADKRPDYQKWIAMSFAVLHGVGTKLGCELLEEYFPEYVEGEYQTLAQSFDPSKTHWKSLGKWAPITDPREAFEKIRFQAQIEAYYDPFNGRYFLKSARGVWHPLTERDLKRQLKSKGISTTVQEGQVLSEADQFILHLQDYKDVHYAGRLCGRKEGFYELGPTRILVTESFRLCEPRPGDWSDLRAVLQGLLGSDPEHGPTQLNVIHGWMQGAQRALRGGHIQAAQALAVAGPAGCGKSFLQSMITEMLGGRVAKPHRYMSGGTEFNSELFEAEHLALEDEFMGSEFNDRQKLGSALKNMCVSTRTQSCHRKNRPAVTLPAWWRVSITLNDDPEALRVLPPLDDHIADKLIILRAFKFPFPHAMDSAENQDAFKRKIVEQLPAYLFWLENDFILPADLVDAVRYGVVSWKHPDLEAALNSLSPEAHLLAMIDEVMWKESKEPWCGTSAELQRVLFHSDDTASVARKLLSWKNGNACGTYLGRLTKKPNPRIFGSRKADSRQWTIKPPP